MRDHRANSCNIRAKKGDLPFPRSLPESKRHFLNEVACEHWSY
ncbi:MAG: hypothetical protein Q8L97_01070 [Nitrosomonas sp.]|nr:hypothetical protein [Nitrosomonas sp.]MDP1548740.1 hypothetical protein [Nitrosomonas sp.]